MELLLKVRLNGAAGQEVREVLANISEGTRVADLATVLQESLGHNPSPEQLQSQQPAPLEAPGVLRLVRDADTVAAQVPPLWLGGQQLDPEAPLEAGPIHDGATLSLVGADPVAGEPTGLVELRVVGGPGAGLVRRMGLGDYTVGGETADISLPGLEEPLVRVRVKTGPEVSVEPIEQAQKAEAPIRPVRNRKLPGPLVLRIRAGETAKSTSQQETRQQRRRRKKLDRHRRKENKRRLKRGEQPFKQAQPHVEQDPDARRRLIELDRRPIEGSLPWEAEVILGVGQSQLTVGPVPAADAVVVQGSETFTLDFNRPPRLARPQRHAKFTLPRQPQPARKPPFSLIMLVGPLVMGVGMYLLTQRLASLMFTALSPLMMLGNFFTMRSQSNRTHRDEVIKYEEMKQDVEAKAFEALLEEHQLRRGDYPDPAEVMLRATGPRAALWERRYENPDWLVLRVGTADQRSEVELTLPDRAAHEEPYRWTAPDVPVTLSMQQLGVVGVYGPLRRQIAAWMVSQCAVLHSPAELELSILLDPKCSGAAESDWSWSCWLPHIRMPEGKGARLRVATEDTTVSKQVNALLTIIEERQEKKSRRPKTPTIFVVLEGARALRHAPGMIQALREGPGAGVVFLCLDDDRVALPEECRAVLQAEEPLANLSITDEDSIEQVTLDVPIDGWFEQVARSLAPYRDAATKGAEGTIPRSSRFLDIINMPEPSAEEVLKRWTTGTQTTVAVIGEDSEGLFQVDVRADGPHALVAGTTGSGKSELLQTLIASLCIENTPEHMTFVLVDYKGGAAFKDCALLPHTVGMVTDLDGHLTSRALDSLGAELRRREHMLANADAKDIEDYTAAMQPGDEPMPRLMLVIDEFAALVSELPDFVTGLVDIARRGRSLGVHLVLATQRPAGVVSAEIKSNTNLRIALRVTDESDSQDVVESNASAYIPPSIPGRAHARLGHGRLLQFQAARVGGRPHGAVRTSEPQIEDLNLRDLSWPAPVGPVIEEDISIPTDLSALVNAMLEARSEQGLPAPHRPWLEPLPGTLVLDDLQIAYGEPSPAAEQKDQTSFSEGFLPPVVIGLEDLPALQEQRLMTWDYTHTAHLGVAGAPRSGRSTVLRLIAVEIARSASPADVHLYGIDGGSGALLPLVAFPHFGAVILRDQTDRLRRLITKLGTEIARRQQLLALEGYSSISEQRAAVAPGEKLPYIVILLDQWDGIVAVYQQVDGGDLLEKLENLMREGSAVGLRFVLTGDRLVFRGRMGTLLEDRLLLRMPTPEDFDLVGLRSRDVPLEMVPGRGFRTGVKPREVQIALLDQDHAGTAQVAAIQKESQSAQQRWGTIPKELQPPRVDELPLVIDADKAMKMVSTPIVGMVPLGVGGDSLDLLSVSMEEIGNGLLVTGPRRSGKSNSLTFILNYLLQAGVRTLLVLPRRSPLHAWTGKPGVLGVLDSSGTKADVEQILGPEDSDVVVIIDDFEVLGNDHVLADALWGHLKACRDNTGGVLMACGIDDLQAGYRGLLADIRKTRTGLILAPRSAGDGDSFSARLPRSVGAPVPLGRGLMITSQGWSWVQVPRQEHP